MFASIYNIYKLAKTTAMVRLLTHHHLHAIQLSTTALRQSLHQPLPALCCSGCWLVVALLSTACFHHRTSSCDRWHSCWWPLCRQLLTTSLRWYQHQPPPNLLLPSFFGLLCYCLLMLPAFVVARRLVTISALVAGCFCHQSSTAALRWSHHQPLPTPCCSLHWLFVALLSATHFHHCTQSCNRRHSRCWLLLMPIIDHFLQVVLTPAAARLCCSHCCLVVAMFSVAATHFCHCMLSCNHQRSYRRPLSPPIANRCPQAVLSPVTACLCCSHHWLFVALLPVTRFCHCMPSCNRWCSRHWPLLPLIIDNLFNLLP